MKTVFEFECNLDGSEDRQNFDEWGCAFVWDESENYGVEYNLCIEDGENLSAIYFTTINQETGYMETNYNLYEHYEIDFDNPDWKNKLEEKMNEVLKKFLANNF